MTQGKIEVQYNILTEFGILIKLVWLIEMCLNGIYSTHNIVKHLYDTFPNDNGLKQEALLPLLYSFTLEYAIRREWK
jgi:hypothetical protein